MSLETLTTLQLGGQIVTATIILRQTPNYNSTLLDRNKLTDIEKRLVVTKGEVGKEWIGSLELADANYFI